MNVVQAKEATRTWVESYRRRWPGLRAAHLVGGITTMADDAPFPATKDIDVHLIFADDDPVLAGGPWASMVEEAHDGLMIEAGLKPVSLYASAEAVLANPEIAHHLTVDSILYDPNNLLADLQPAVRRDYRRRQWVCARVAYERQALHQALGMLAAAGGMWGASGEVNLLGYTTTFATAVLWIASLEPPQMGSRTVVRLRELLTRHRRLDLYQGILEDLGLAHTDRAFAEQSLREAAAAFDLVTAIRRRPDVAGPIVGPFQHKLHAHLRPYFVNSSRAMLDEGYHHEALAWITPYQLSTADVIVAHGSGPEMAEHAERQQRFLRALGLDTPEARAAAVARLTSIHDEVFTLADAIVATHPDVID
jgi:hypothetical protein